MESHAATRSSVLTVGDTLPRIDLLDERGQVVDLREVSRETILSKLKLAAHFDILRAHLGVPARADSPPPAELVEVPTADEVAEQ